ncbi:MAG: aldo/keto reductase [Burkholderiales bacterium]|nr:aldo/keto reductase [Burkholderiales bacterium]
MMNEPFFTLNDGFAMPQLGLGVWGIENKDVPPVVSSALEAGYRLIDTAALYQNEEGVGRAVTRSLLPRAEIFVTTKLANHQHGHAKDALQESLARLGLSYVNLYLIHWPLPAQDRYVETWRQMIELKQQGLTHSIGVSNFTEAHLTRLIEETGVVPAVNQVEIHPTFQQQSLHAFHKKHGIVTQSWSPLGQGRDVVLPEITKIAAKYQKTPAQVIVRWHLQHNFSVIPKSATLWRIRENKEVCDFALTDDDMNQIDALNQHKRMGLDPETFSL